MFKKLLKNFPPLYTCSKCGKTVKIKNDIIKRSCKCPDDTIVFANRKVTLIGGKMSKQKKFKQSIILGIRKVLCNITGRSI